VVLLVEDDPDGRDFGASALAQLGHRVLEAADADSALDQSPSILISPCCSRMRGTPLCTVAWSMPHVQALQIYELGRASDRRYSSERRANLHASISPELCCSHQLTVNDFKHLIGDVPSRALTYAHLTKHAFLNQSFNI